jgi:hypothetical protein
MHADLPNVSMSAPPPSEPQNVMDTDGSLTALLVDPALNEPIPVCTSATMNGHA